MISPYLTEPDEQPDDLDSWLLDKVDGDFYVFRRIRQRAWELYTEGAPVKTIERIVKTLIGEINNGKSTI